MSREPILKSRVRDGKKWCIGRGSRTVNTNYKYKHKHGKRQREQFYQISHVLCWMTGSFGRCSQRVVGKKESSTEGSRDRTLKTEGKRAAGPHADSMFRYSTFLYP